VEDQGDSFPLVLYRRRIVEQVGPHCDLVKRLADVPQAARVRGVYFRSALEEVTRRGLRQVFEAVIPETDRSVFTLYPLADYLLWLAWAGSLVASPASVHDGMRELSRGNAVYYGRSLLGRSLARLLSRDPIRLLHQAMQSKRAVSNYGRWQLIEEGPRHAIVRLEEEYVWIESALLGAALGALECCEIQPTAEVRLRDSYNGDLVFRW
jgi:uncharacterized protein (TIGR02265 family)